MPPPSSGDPVHASVFDYEPPISLPRAPAVPPPSSFPMLALLAPIGASVVLWAITRSTFVLVFAFLGPVIAVASYLDSRLQSRRQVRRERVRFEAETAATTLAIERSHRRERAELLASHPGVQVILAAAAASSGPSVPGPSARAPALVDLVRWQRMPPGGDGGVRGSPSLLRLGMGDTRSRLLLPPPISIDASDPATASTLDRLMEASLRLRDAPIIVDLVPTGSARDASPSFTPGGSTSAPAGVGVGVGAGVGISVGAGIGVCGARPIARACARTLIVQLSLRLTPEHWSLRVHCAPDAVHEWTWLTSLPHEIRIDCESLVRDAPNALAALEKIEFVPAVVGASYLICLSDSAVDLPRTCRSLIVIDEITRARLIHRDDPAPGAFHPPDFAPDFASVEQARRLAVALDAFAREEGIDVGTRSLPAAVAFDDLPNKEVSRSDRGLPAAIWIGRARAGPSGSEIDLVGDGPHAVVGGTTGSGKSELLITWVLALAARHPPSSVNFLLVDFKGGASFAAVESLPHCVGLVSDLDPAVAHRALTSLRAEVRFRERMLAAAGARSIDELGAADAADVVGAAGAAGAAAGSDSEPGPTLARLVIVVDEFAALASDFPELHSLFVDLAARGRSLGIHLILCTQRPADTLRDSILANCSIRISLRVATRADSSAVIGTPHAAELPRSPVGRALVSIAGEAPELVQIARASPADGVRVGTLRPGAPAPRRPWCDPLPTKIALGELARPVTGYLLGILDLPAEQRLGVGFWNPPSHGGLLVLGASRSGRTNVLGVLEAQAPGAIRVSQHPSVAWEQLRALTGALTRGSAAALSAGSTDASPHASRVTPEDADPVPKLVLIDDVDLLIDRFPRDHQTEFVELLARLLADGPGAGMWCALAARSVTTTLRPISAALPAQLVLRMPNRQEHVLAGGAGDAWNSREPAGRGAWHGDPLQVALIDERPTLPPAAAPALTFPAGGVTALVTANPSSVVQALTRMPGVHVVALEPRTGQRLDVSSAALHTVIVGSVDAWHGRGGVAQMTSVGAATVVNAVFDGCSVSEFRALSRSRVVPPPLLPGAASVAGGVNRDVWLVAGEGPVQRVRLELASASR